MTLLTTRYFWKEWRDQRATLGWLAGAVLLLAGGGMLFAPGKYVTTDVSFLSFLAMGMSYLAVLLTIGTDLLPGEIARGKIRFLERLPAGLGTPFLAKILFFLAASAAAMAYGVLIVAICSAIRRGVLPESVLPEGLPPTKLDYWLSSFRLVPLFGITLWGVTVSAWVPRSALAIPAAAILVLVLCWPLWLIMAPIEWYSPRGWEVAGLGILSLVGAPLSAWVSFTRGLRFGRAPRQAAKGGLAVAVLFMIPAWVWTGDRIHQLRSIDPYADDFCMYRAVVGEGERYAFVTAARNLGDHPLPHAMVVDLATGEWWDEGVGSWWPCDEPESRSSRRHRTEARLVWRWHESDSVCYDARTALPVDPPPDAWRHGALPRIEELGIEDHVERIERAGFGFHVKTREPTGELRDHAIDPERGIRTTFDDLSAHLEESIDDTLVRPGMWLCRLSRGGAWQVIDPVTGEHRAMHPLGSTSRPNLMPDGRLLVRDDDGACFVDPETGEVEWLRLPPDVSDVQSIWPIGWTGHEAPSWVLRANSEESVTLLRYDPATRVLRSTGVEMPRWFIFIGTPDENTAYVLVTEGLLRLRFDGRDAEVLFPRPDPLIDF